MIFSLIYLIKTQVNLSGLQEGSAVFTLWIMHNLIAKISETSFQDGFAFIEIDYTHFNLDLY